MELLGLSGEQAHLWVSIICELIDKWRGLFLKETAQKPYHSKAELKRLNNLLKLVRLLVRMRRNVDLFKGLS